ncbi:ATP-binding protein [Streptomyces sp. NPDC048479]|uniref:ATP-binding protein n=1 Tax=Streptomyces sp. NPDC048479 TaxID=3154725 RepID=UPI00343B7C32
MHLKHNSGFTSPHVRPLPTASSYRFTALRFPHSARSAIAGRTAVADRVRAWGLDHDLQEPASLVVSELVGNAVRHATGPMHVLAACGPDWLDLAVSDGGAVFTPPAAQSTLLESGRGLLLVDAMSSAWAVLPEAGGKTVAVRLPADAPQPEWLPGGGPPCEARLPAAIGFMQWAREGV